MYWEKIEGSFSFVNFYERMAHRFNNATFVEIGTWKGQSIMYMAEKIKELNKNIKLYGIDTFKGNEEHAEHPDVVANKIYDIYLENIEPLKDYITTIKGSSHDVYTQFEDESIDFLFIDADHSYEAVKKDLKLWYPKVKKGGIISGHDYFWVDARVKRAVDEFFLFTGVLQDSGDTWYKIKK
jgi:predicted O-methyltransferase YrrM